MLMDEMMPIIPITRRSSTSVNPRRLRRWWADTFIIHQGWVLVYPTRGAHGLVPLSRSGSLTFSKHARTE